jgi:Zn-dependent peptidase ImmA (M78 family)/DNA-binding XRE family transcriptional regulator
MLGERIKQFRLAKGLSLDELAAKLGGVVSKNALSKYERNIMRPSLVILSKIARALETKIFILEFEPELTTEFIAYRKGSGLGKNEQEKVESLVKKELEERIHLQEKLGINEILNISVKGYVIDAIADAENAAEVLRKSWELGLNPIGNLIALLEGHNVHVILNESHTKFDGISSLTKNSKGYSIAAGVVSNINVPGERQRFNLAHELGHLVLNVSPSVDEEKAAYRFAGAFLAPKESLLKNIGNKRSLIQFSELFLLKKYYGMSIQALVYRIKDLEIINENYAKKLFMMISKKGWKREEPYPLDAERPLWLNNAVKRAFSEKIITGAEANLLLNTKEINIEPTSLTMKKEFLKLNTAEKSKHLAREAEVAAKYYNENAEWKELIFGDIIEY